MTPHQHRLAILRKHAKLGPGGQPSLCRAERGTHPNGKVTFRTKAAAERAIAELYEWTNSLCQVAYQCPAGNHFHMTKRSTRPGEIGAA